MTITEQEESGEDSPLGGDEIAMKEIDRAALLEMLSIILRNQHKKALNGRIRDEKRYKLRIDGIRAFAYVASVYGSILKDKDLSDITKRLEVLESNANKS